MNDEHLMISASSPWWTTAAPFILVAAIVFILLLIGLGVFLDRRRRERRWQKVRERRIRLTQVSPAAEATIGRAPADSVEPSVTTGLQSPAHPVVPALASVHEMYIHRVQTATGVRAHKGQTTRSLLQEEL